MKLLRYIKLLIGALLLFLLGFTMESCRRTGFYTAVPSKNVRELNADSVKTARTEAKKNKKKDQSDEDTYWAEDDEYDSWEEMEEHDRDR